MLRTEKSIEIHAPVERVFDLFSDFENFPRWMRHVKDVHYTGPQYTRWTADAPLGFDVEWEAETTHFEPDHRIAWRTVRGDVDMDGEVIFEDLGHDTTLMRVVLGYDPPAGRLGTLVASLFGKDPDRQLDDDLQRFAEVVEAREETEREHARRDHAPARERRDYVRDRLAERRRYEDERLGDSGRPPGRDGALYDRERARTGSRREYQGDGRYGDEYRPRVYTERQFGPAGARDRESRERFDEALREARQSQLEGQRRYREQRARDERERYREEYHGINRRADERRREEREERRPARRDDEEESRSRTRHAMTPRERELERARRQPDYGYSREAFRRGVDKLMDEPPSDRWRR